jgi:putative membrane protein insertion efficiency factor
MFKKIAIFPIRLYQWFIRPLLPKGACVFEPSCSVYTVQAIEKYGPIKGGYLGVKRILRCHPWQKQHYDPLI